MVVAVVMSPIAVLLVVPFFCLSGFVSNLYVLCAEPKEHKHFRPGTRLGGLVTGVTQKLFMC